MELLKEAIIKEGELMGRIADSTIKGFMYQFNLSLNEILKSTNEIVKIEGIIEDIDRINEENITAIQCKYHEEVEKFQWSKVSKPILQMLKTYTNSDGNNISFVLYAFFPSEQLGEKAVSKNELNEMLNTKNIEYICDYIAHIKKIENPEIKNLVRKERKTKEEKEKIRQYFIANELEVLYDIDDFLNNRFRFVVGREYYELEEENKMLLCQNGFSQDDVNDIAFPNAIQKIASLSILKEDEDRNITKKELLEELKGIRKTAISRWTRELSNYKELLISRRKQLGKSLNVNYRKRCFVFEPTQIENFEQEIVLFIKNYIDIYCCKPKLHIPAIFCILGYDKEKMDGLISRLYEKGIEAETGYRGSVFYPEAFIKKPERKVSENWLQFKIKICSDNEECIEAINRNKQDDIFQITEHLSDAFSTRDVNREILDVNSFSQIEYLLRIKDEVEI